MGICVNFELNCLSKLQVYKIFLKLVKNKFAYSCLKLVDKLNDNNIIISTLSLRIFCKVNKVLVNYQMIVFAKAQGYVFIDFCVQALI